MHSIDAAYCYRRESGVVDNPHNAVSVCQTAWVRSLDTKRLLFDALLLR